MSMLFSPYRVRGVDLKNRIVMSLMCMYSSMSQDGKVKDFHRFHYASRAMGQVGLIILESTAIHPQGRISVLDLGIWHDDHIPGLKTIVNAVHEFDSKIGIQISHAGRKADVEGTIIAFHHLFHMKYQ